MSHTNEAATTDVAADEGYTKLISDAVETALAGPSSFQKSEAQARELASSDPQSCLVPETTNEYYDCCGSDAVQNVCTTFGWTNAVILAMIVLAWIYLIARNQWFRNQWVLVFCFIFQILPAVWRTLFYLVGGWPGASTFEFITYRSSDPGDFVVSLTGLAMYLYQLRQKYEHEHDPEFDYHALKKRLAIGFWVMFAIYSAYWGTFYWVTLHYNSLVYVDVAVSAYFGFLIVLYLTQGVGLIKALNHKAGIDAEDPMETRNAPGAKYITWLLILQVFAMFLRMVFVSLQDINKVSKIESINKGTQYWDEVMAVQCCTQIFATGAFFLSVYWVHAAEKATALAAETQPINSNPNKMN